MLLGEKLLKKAAYSIDQELATLELLKIRCVSVCVWGGGGGPGRLVQVGHTCLSI